MTPPEAGATGSDAGSAMVPPAVSVCADGAAARPATEVLKKRADFLRAASARRQGTPGFLVQARRRDDGAALIRVGFTCSKKIGNAVARNRAKRRLREVARAILPVQGLPGWDYVLVGRPGATIDRPFAALLADLAQALRQIHSAAPHTPRPRKP
jgi:ribonuclease P protein component